MTKTGTFDPEIPLAVSYGGGTNSTAMLCGFRERGIRPAIVIFADTGNERGYGFDEPGRGKKAPTSKTLKTNLRETYWYPLREWGWDRAACVAAIQRHGLPLAGKSACWFCPSSKPSEVLKLRDEAPDLLARALEIERRAQARNTTPRGLGGARNLWSNWLNDSDSQGVFVLDLEPVHVPCGCTDGD